MPEPIRLAKPEPIRPAKPEPIREQLRNGLKGARLEAGLTLRALAERCGMSKSGLGAFETGDAFLSPETIDRMATELGVSLEVTVRRGTDPAAPAQVSTLGHGTCVDALVHLFRRHRIEVATEEHITFNGVDRYVDLLGFDARMRRLIVVEVKTELRDVGDLKRQVSRYALAAIQAANRLGWQPLSIRVVIVVLQTSDAEEMIHLHRHQLADIAPIRGRAAVRMMLDGADATAWGLLMIDPLRPGRSMLTSTLVDGRRTGAPYLNYADFISRLKQRG